MGAERQRLESVRRTLTALTAAAALWSPLLAAAHVALLATPAAAAAQEPDADLDTMPDAWETFFGLNPNDPSDATGDPDNDGLTNAQEYAAHRHPRGFHTRFFPEGATGYFDTSVAIINLSPTLPAHVAVALLTESGDTVTQQLTLDPRQRRTLSIDDILGPIGAVSTVIESDVPIAADRSMTWGPSGIGGTLDSGVASPSTTWYFAEGATGSFLTYYLFENPGTTAANVTVRYLQESGPPILQQLSLPEHSRTTVLLNLQHPDLAWASFGAAIVSDVPILAERAMYLVRDGAFGGGSSSSGSDRLATQWYFGEGATGPFFQAFLTLANPGTTPTTATVTYHMSDGTTASKPYVVDPASRRTVYFNGEAASDPALAALAMGPVWFSVSATQPIVAERAMWWSTWPWYEGHAAPGNTAPDLSWAVPEGRHEPGNVEQTYLLIGNTSNAAGLVRLTLIGDTGVIGTRELPIPAAERLTVEVGSLFGLTAAARFSAIVESIGGAPVPLVVDYARYRTNNGIPFSSGGAAPAIPFSLTPADAAPFVASTTPANGATGASSHDDIVVTFSEPVNVGATAFSLQCPNGSAIALTNLTTSPATAFTLDPAVALPPSTSCTLTVSASAVTDVDATDPPDAMAANFTATFTTAAEGAPTVASTTPAAGATSVSRTANVTITFSEPVTVTGNWFQIVCTTSGTRTVADTVVGGGPTTFTIDPNADFADGESCTVTVVAAQVADQDAIDPPDAMAADHVFGFSLNLTPQVSGTVPANTATQVGTAADLAITFSEPVTVTGNWFQIVCTTSGTRTAADAVVSGGPTTYTINPNIDFAAGETCTVTIVAAQVADQDSVGAPHTLPADYVFAFTTDTPPAVTATAPAGGSTTATTTTDLTVTFSEPVNVAGNWFQIVCATSGTRNVADTVITGGPTTFTINPAVDFAAGESCTVTIAAALVADQDAGDPPDTLTANFVFSFTTDAAPSVTATTPAAAATVAAGADLTVTFNEAVNVTGNWFQIVCTTSGTRNVADTVVSGGPTTFTINPNVDFTAGESCTLTVVATQVADQDGDDPPDTMAANHAVGFAIDAAPSVTATTPANGSVVTANSDLTLTFSEPVDVTGAWFQIVCATSGTRNVGDTVVTGGPTTFTINPNADFTAGESCTVTVFAAQVSDQDALDAPDTMTANFVFSFAGDAAPAVSASTPANSATQVATTANLSVTFTEPVDVTGNWFQIVCATSGTRTVADTVVSGGPTTFTINPNADFAVGEACTVTIVAAQITDQDAADPPNVMAANHVFAFTADTAPSITATSPTNGSTGSTTSTNLILTFDEAVNVTGNWFQIVCTVTGTRNVTDTNVSGGPSAFTIDPTVDFAAGESCTVTVAAAAVTDQDAGDPPDAMAADYVFTFTIDAQPSVTATTPTNGASVTASANLAITFSENVNVAGTWFQIVCDTSGTRNPGNTAVSGGPSTFTLNPNVDFTAGESCTVTVAAAQVSDQDGIDPPDTMAADHVFSFTVDAAPSVTSTTPANGASAVAASANVSLTFSEAVNVTANWFQIVCTTSGTRNVSDTVVSGGPTTFGINPNADFTAGETCTVTVTAAQVADQDAVDPPDTMTANYVFSFTIDAAPSVTSTTPVNGATQIATTASPAITFSEAVDVTGNWFQIVCTSSGTRNVSDTAVTGGPTTFGINPAVDFTAGETCTVTVFAAQVTDQDAVDPPDAMAANYVFSFTIDAAPSVTATSPTNGATGVVPSTTIGVTFSESVNASTSSFTVQCPSSNHAFTLSSSPATSFTLTPTTALPEGVICTVTVLAAQVTDADAGDPPDTMLANYVFSFAIPPNAVNDSRNATGNVSINTAGSGFSVLANDIGPGIAISASDTTSLRGGTVTVNSSTGEFFYNPPAGFEGTDTFTYTITNAAGSDVGTVTITISGMLWFIDDSATSCVSIASNCGRLSNPMSLLSAFNSANGGSTTVGGDVVDPEAGDHVFIYSGSYANGLTVLGQQRVIGQGAASSLAALSGVTPATDSAALPSTGGAKPILSTQGIVLGANNQLHGLALSSTSGAAISGATNVGTLVMSDITINNTSGGGISLTGGGTVTLTGSANTIATTTGVPLTVTNTTIGAAGLTFQSIAANGAANGILLNNTGSSGGLTVTGTGTAGTGGTIQNITTRGVTLQSTRAARLSFMNLTNANTADAGGAGVCDGTTNTACNAAIYLNGAVDVDLTNITISGTTADEGINGLNVTDLDLTNVTISNVGNAIDEYGIYIRNLLGTAAAGTTNVWNNVQISGSGNHNVFVVASTATNAAPGSPDRLEITGSSFTSAGTAVLSDGITVAVRSAGNFQTVVSGSTFSNNDTDCIQVDAGDTSTSTVSITSSTFTLCNIGINLSGANTSTTNFTVSGNTNISSTQSHGVNLASNNSAALRGTVSNNTITTSTANNNGSGIDLVVDQSGSAVVDVSNNQITNLAIGMRGGARNAGGTADITVSGNTMSTGGSFPLYGLYIFSGNNNGQTNRTCVNLSNNTIDADGVGAINDYAFEQYVGSTFQIQGLTGSGSTAANVQAFMAATDLDPSPSDPTTDAFVGTTVNYTAAVCQVP